MMAVDESKPGPVGEFRLAELDGLRGWAALSVVLFHVFWETFGQIEPGFRNVATASLCNGGLAVTIFFVLSGEALAAAYWRTGSQRAVLRQMVKRYPRLTLPIFVSCLGVFLLARLGLVHAQEAAAIVDRPDWLGSFLAFTPDAASLLRYAFIDVYADPADPRSYNPFLWTMQTELVGSFLLFAILLAERFITQRRLTILALLALIFFQMQSFVGCFLFGMVFAWMQARGTFAGLRQIRWLQYAAPIAIVAALLFAGQLQSFGQLPALAYMAPAVALVFFVHCSAAATAFFRTALSRFLGEISFPLYLVHFAVLVSLTSAAIVFADRHGGLTTARIWAIALASVAASLVLALAFRTVEMWTQRACNAIGRLVPASSQDGNRRLRDASSPG
jgi:peptidoglycan/LPS O-acetylase OafA/YrhL